MRIAPSSRLKKQLRVVTDENEYIANLETRQQYLRQMTDCMDSDFGMTILAAFEQIESQAYGTLYKTNIKSRVAQAKAEIKTVQYMKGIFMSLRSDKATTDAMLEKTSEEQNDES